MENDWCIDCRLTLIPATGLWGKITPSTVFAKNSDTCDCDSSLRERLDVRYKPSNNNNNNTSKWNESRKLFLDIVTDPPGLSTTVERMSISASFLSGHDRKSWRRFVHFADFESIPTWHCSLSLVRNAVSSKFQRLPHIFRYSRLLQLVSIARRQATTADNRK